MNNETFKKDLLDQCAYALARIELRKYKQVGLKSIAEDYKEIKTFFNGSSFRIALASLLYVNYFEKKLLTKMIVSKKLHKTHKATYELINRCDEMGLIVYEKPKNFKASPLFLSAYTSYTENEVIHLREPISNLASLMNSLNYLSNFDTRYQKNTK